jgi:hypothetical protein
MAGSDVGKLNLVAWSEEAAEEAPTLSDAGRLEYDVTDVQRGSLDGFELVEFALAEADILDGVVAVRIVG